MFSIFSTVLFVLIFINRFTSLHRGMVMEHHIGLQNMAENIQYFFFIYLSSELDPVISARYSKNLFWITLKAIS